METNKTVSSGKFTIEIITGSFLYGSLIIILYELIKNYIMKKFEIDSLTMKFIITISFEAVIMFVIWKMGILYASQRFRIERSEVDSVIRNLIITTGIVSMILVSSNFIKLDREMTNLLDTNQIIEKICKEKNIKLNSQEIKEAESIFQKEIENQKKQLYIKFFIFRVLELIINLMVVLMQKKSLKEISI